MGRGPRGRRSRPVRRSEKLASGRPPVAACPGRAAAEHLCVGQQCNAEGRATRKPRRAGATAKTRPFIRPRPVFHRLTRWTLAFGLTAVREGDDPRVEALAAANRRARFSASESPARRERRALRVERELLASAAADRARPPRRARVVSPLLFPEPGAPRPAARRGRAGGRGRRPGSSGTSSSSSRVSSIWSRLSFCRREDHRLVDLAQRPLGERRERADPSISSPNSSIRSGSRAGSSGRRSTISAADGELAAFLDPVDAFVPGEAQATPRARRSRLVPGRNAEHARRAAGRRRQPARPAAIAEAQNKAAGFEQLERASRARRRGAGGGRAPSPSERRGGRQQRDVLLADEPGKPASATSTARSGVIEPARQNDHVSTRGHTSGPRTRLRDPPLAAAPWGAPRKR